MHCRGCGRFDHHRHRGRRDDYHRSCAGNCACRSLGYHGTGGRTRGNCRRRRGRGNNRRRRTWLRNNNPARGRMRSRRSRGSRSCGRRRSWRGGRRCCGSGCCGGPGRGGRCGRFRCGSCRRLRRQASVARLFFFFLLGQDGLHHIAGLGDVREVDLWDDGLTGEPDCRSGRMGRRFSILRKTRANLLRLVQFQ